MKLQIVPPGTGIQWLRLALMTFRAQPMALAALFVLALVAMSLLSVLPLIGPVMAQGLMPALTLTMMVASAETIRGRRPTMSLLLIAFRSGSQRRQSMLTLCAMFSVGFFIILGLSTLIDDGAFAQAFLGIEPVTQELVDNPEFRAAMWLCMLLLMPLTVLFWHAPGLVHWHNIAPVKALFFSIVAWVRNIRAFCVFGLAWLGLVFAVVIGMTLVVGLFTMIIQGLTGDATMGIMTGRFIVTLCTVGLATIFLCSIVFSFRDCFTPPDQPDTSAPDDALTHEATPDASPPASKDSRQP